LLQALHDVLRQFTQARIEKFADLRRQFQLIVLNR